MKNRLETIEMTFVEKSVLTFDQYYPIVFENKSTKTLIIPSSNDLVNDYFYGKIDPNDHPSKYDAGQTKKRKRTNAKRN